MSLQLTLFSLPSLGATVLVDDSTGITSFGGVAGPTGFGLLLAARPTGPWPRCGSHRGS